MEASVLGQPQLQQLWTGAQRTGRADKPTGAGQSPAKGLGAAAHLPGDNLLNQGALGH